MPLNPKKKNKNNNNDTRPSYYCTYVLCSTLTNEKIAAGRGSGSTGIPTAAELTARTIEEGGDGRSTTPDFIPRIHERLADEHKTEGGRLGRRVGPGRRPGGRTARVPRVAGRGRGGVDWCVMGASGKTGRAEWRLCEPRTVHYTQRGSRGSGFSCGYRNIQVMCSALMEWPEYRRWGAGCGLRFFGVLEFVDIGLPSL